VFSYTHTLTCVFCSWWKDITSRPSWEAVKEGVAA
jgi:hypothetical protein